MLTAMLFALPGLGIANQYGNAQLYAYDYIIKVPVEVKNLLPGAHYMELYCTSQDGPVAEPGLYVTKRIKLNKGYVGTVSFPIHAKVPGPSVKEKCVFMLLKTKAASDPSQATTPFQGAKDKSGSAVPVWAQAKKGAFFRVNTGYFTLKGHKI